MDNLDMSMPTPLMLALSVAVLAIDPSVPKPLMPVAMELEANWAHWRAVASYAEAFPKALAKKVVPKVVPEEQDDVAVEGVGMRIQAEAREIRQAVGI